MSTTRDRAASRPAHSPAAEEPAPPASPASAPGRTARPTRAEWTSIAIFAIPCGALYPTQLLSTLVPVGSEHFLLIQDCVNMGLLVLALAIAGRVFLSDFSYLRTRPIRKVAALLGLFALTMIAQKLANNALSTPSSFGDGSLRYFTEGFGGLVFSFIIALGGPLIEEVFFRHFLIGTLSAYAPHVARRDRIVPALYPHALPRVAEYPLLHSPGPDPYARLPVLGEEPGLRLAVARPQQLARRWRGLPLPRRRLAGRTLSAATAE